MAKFGFELDPRLVSERGVEALGVVDGLDELADVAAGGQEVSLRA